MINYVVTLFFGNFDVYLLVIRRLYEEGDV
jgi:hypothetical protein